MKINQNLKLLNKMRRRNIYLNSKVHSLFNSNVIVYFCFHLAPLFIALEVLFNAEKGLTVLIRKNVIKIMFYLNDIVYQCKTRYSGYSKTNK